MKRIAQRKLTSKIAMLMSGVAAAIGLFFLVYILYEVLRHGVIALNSDLFTQDQVPPFLPEQGGLRHAFVGQLMLTAGAVIIGVPMGILGGTYLSEYGRHSRFGQFVSTLADIMVSVPSIIVGSFIYAIMVKPLGHFSGYSGSVALAVIMLPVVVRTTEEMMRMVPWQVREAAFALGAPYYKVIMQVVYRGAATGIFTGILLAVARIAGETAPLLFTSFNNNFFSTDMAQPVPSLTVTIYEYAGSPFDTWISLAWAASFVITFSILIVTIAGRLIIKWRYKN